MRGNFAESNDSDTVDKSVVWPPVPDDEKVDVSTSRRHGSESWMSVGRNEPSYSDLLSGFGVTGLSSHPSLVDQMTSLAYPARKHSADHEDKLNVRHPWHATPSGLSLNLMDNNTKGTAHGGDKTYQARGNLRYSTFGEYLVLQGHKVEHPHGNLMPPPFPTQYQSPCSRELMSKPMTVKDFEALKPKDGDCKLFGISLINSPTAPDPSVSQKNVTIEPAGSVHPTSHQQTSENDHKPDNSKTLKPVDGLVVIDDHEKPSQTSQLHLKDVQFKSLSSARSCTKVRFFNC